ncbi:unnamed protein product [Parascedosporium putredinis]|uniref:WD40 repeat-like protein n=1 Tax=Parascedosporium putredinis TaxID=1442378 RepID=A0A9P1HBA0_9PEZI|nr:unnamed protein product [Parascedosporium putredinis]CAI8003473.1 unnamed protein product [Parascedosporium putredinis]
MSPTEPGKYAPLGLADIRPRADSTMSDGVPGSMAYEFANAQPTPSNYLAPWALYAFDWCKWQTHGNSAGKVAIASYLEDGHNFTPDHTAPLTSLDWNTISPSLIITSSIDTTCTIWDIPSLTAKTQLIAHDKEVYDVRFCANSVDMFVSCGQDGSVRMFDLRSLEHSTIIYEPTGKDERDANGGRISPTLAQQTMANPPPLLRLATSPHDQNLLATFAQDSNIIRILDVRQPGQALLELRGHGGSLNCVEWSPHRRGTLISGADDCQVLIWDLMNSAPPSAANGGGQQENHRSPTASWQCDYESI